MSLYLCHKKGLYFPLDKRVMLSSKKKLRTAQRGSPLWHEKLNHCLLMRICPLLCPDRARDGRGKQPTPFFPHPLFLVRCQMAMSWTHQGLFSFQFPWLTQQWWQPCCLKQTRSTGGPLPRKALTHTLQVCEKFHTMYLKINHRLTLLSEHCCKGLAPLRLEEPSSQFPYPFISFLSSAVNTSFQSFPLALHFSLLPILPSV